MRLLCSILLFVTLTAVADRRGLLMQRRSLAGASSSGPTVPNVTSQPGIWLDVLQQVTNSVANGTLITNMTNYGYLGGYFTDNGSPTTNFFYRTIEGGVLTGRAVTQGDGLHWLTNGVDGNNQCYFQSNFGTIAIRFNQKDSDHSPGFVQTGDAGHVSPSSAYCYLQHVSGTWYFDWGAGAANRISSAEPSGDANVWLNAVYVKSNAIQQIWLAGTNWLQGNSQNGNLYPTNNFAGPLLLAQGLHATNYLVKRILFWNYALTPGEITNLNSWLTAMP